MVEKQSGSGGDPPPTRISKQRLPPSGYCEDDEPFGRTLLARPAGYFFLKELAVGPGAAAPLGTILICMASRR